MQVNWSVSSRIDFLRCGSLLWTLYCGREIHAVGVFSLPDFAYGELQIPVETEEEKRRILEKLAEAGLLYEKKRRRNNVKEAVKWNSACGNSYK